MRSRSDPVGDSKQQCHNRNDSSVAPEPDKSGTRL